MTDPGRAIRLGGADSPKGCGAGVGVPTGVVGADASATALGLEICDGASAGAALPSAALKKARCAAIASGLRGLTGLEAGTAACGGRGRIGGMIGWVYG